MHDAFRRLVPGRTLAMLLVAGLRFVDPASAADETAPSPELRAVRVLFLEQLEPRKAKQLVMSAGVRRFSLQSDGRILILSDTPERIDGFVDLVLQFDPGVRVVEPHPPLARPSAEEPTEERVYFTADGSGAMIALRSLYGIRSVEPVGDGIVAEILQNAQVREHDAARAIPAHENILAPPER